MAGVRPFEFPDAEAPKPGSSGQESDLASWVVGKVEQPALRLVPFVDLDEPEQEGPDPSHIAAIEEQARAAGREAGFATGMAEGRKEGLAQGRAAAGSELEAARALLAEATGQLAAARQALAEVHEADMAEIALRLAGEVAGGAIAVEPERVAALAREAVSLLADADSITLRVGVELLPIMQEAVESLENLSGAASVVVVGDQTLDGGACIVESDLARVDLRVEQRLGSARELLASARGEGSRP